MPVPFRDLQLPYDVACAYSLAAQSLLSEWIEANIGPNWQAEVDIASAMLRVVSPATGREREFGPVQIVAFLGQQHR